MSDLLSPNQIIGSSNKYTTRIQSYGANVVSWKRLGDLVGSATALDQISGALNGITHNTTFGQPSLTGGNDKAVSFDGTVASYIDCGVGGVYDLTGAWSIDCWIKLTNNSNANQRVVSKDDVVQRSFVLGFQGIPLFPNLQLNGGNILFGPTQINYGTIYHYGVTYDTVTYTLYLNGISITSGAGASPMISTASFNIGRRAYTSFEEPVLGIIDEVVIYSKCLTPAEMLGNYQAGL